jgi:lysophospholipase L1-like esterase
MLDFTIYGIGDSHMNGAYIHSCLETKVQALLAAAHPTIPWYFANIVHSNELGAITTDMMVSWQLPIVLAGGEVFGTYYPPLPEYVAIWGGVNDIVSVPPHSAAEIEANLQTMYTACHDVGVKVIAMTMPPNRYSKYNTVMKAVNAWILSGVPTDVDFKIDTWGASPNGLEDPADMQYILEDYLWLPYPPDIDGVHMNATGYDVVAGKMFAGVDWNLIRNRTIDFNESGSVYPLMLSSFNSLENVGTWGVNIDLRELFDQNPPSGDEVNWFLTQQTSTPAWDEVTFGLGSGLMFHEFVLRADWIHEAFGNAVDCPVTFNDIAELLLMPYIYRVPNGDKVNWTLQHQDALGAAFPTAYDEIGWEWESHMLLDIESVTIDSIFEALTTILPANPYMYKKTGGSQFKAIHGII